MKKNIKKKNKRFVAIGVFVALLVVSILIYFMCSEYDLDPKQTYSVEIYHSGPMAQNIEELNQEMAALLSCSELPGSEGFIAPVVDLHEKLISGETTRLTIPMGGLSWLGEKFVTGFYDVTDRRDDDAEMLEEGGDLFSRDEYKYFSVSALANGDPQVNQVVHDVSNKTEFFINTKQVETSSSDKVVWKSLAELKKHIDSMVSSGGITSGTVVKIYYKGGNVDGDGDRDGVLDNVDACPGVAGEIACSGCICETVVEEIPEDEEIDLVEPPVAMTEAPSDFVLNNGVLSWASGPEKLVFHVVTSSGTMRAVEIVKGGELRLNEDEYLKLQRTISSSNKRLEYQSADRGWVDCQIKEFSCNKVIKDE